PPGNAILVLASHLLSELKATSPYHCPGPLTLAPLRQKSSLPVSAFQKVTSPPPPLARRLPSGLNATRGPTPLRESNSLPVSASETLTSLATMAFLVSS